MRRPSVERDRAPTRAGPPELVNILGIAGALLAVLGLGAGMSAVLPHPASPWLFAASYGAPAAMAFTVRWWMAQRL